ncbi:hypothetical protein CI109_100077 [Kwoniella shandongensis]|uniref:Peptidase C14 caspase domain-containing protein n=1 Tax=Kwoniella shandongensis TaxID=1734106 RepID=A0AAJ8MTL8_9TREE
MSEYYDDQDGGYEDARDTEYLEPEEYSDSGRSPDVSDRSERFDEREAIEERATYEGENERGEERDFAFPPALYQGGNEYYAPPQSPPQGTYRNRGEDYYPPPGPPPNQYSGSDNFYPVHPGLPTQQYQHTGAGYIPPAQYQAPQPPYGHQSVPDDDGNPHRQHFGPQFTDPSTGEAAQAFFEYSRCNGRRKALLIGINYIGTSNALNGCINDAHNVQKFICHNFGYHTSDIVLLSDDVHDPRTLPTKDNIFFHYSGHGTQVEDVNGDEDDGFDEAICPLDYEEAGLIIDDDSDHDLLVKPLPAGCRLTAIFDSCHSGTVMDLPYIYSTEGKIKEPDLLAEASEGLLGADVIAWSGCKDDQTSADTEEAGKATGAMSFAFIAALTKYPQQSYQQLLVTIREEMKGRYTQKPQLSACHPIDTDLQFVA